RPTRRSPRRSRRRGSSRSAGRSTSPTASAPPPGPDREPQRSYPLAPLRRFSRGMATTPLEDPRDQAFERLYSRYAKDVYRYALAVLRNPADAEDVTQTTFMNAYKAFKSSDEPILKPQNWLIKIAHNACRTRFIRAARRPNEVPL